MQMREMTDLQQRMLNDLDWARRAPEVQENPEHHGKFVIVYNKRILAVGKDSQALLREAAEKAGVPKEHLVTLIVSRPGLWEIPH